MNAELRLYADRFEARSAPVQLPQVRARALYIVDGSLALRGGAATRATLGSNSGASMSEAHEIGGGSLPATVLRWELVENADALSLAGTDSRLLLASEVTLVAPEGHLLRCDRVDFPAGGEALMHTHQGGGTRCLLFGSIRIDTLGESRDYGPLGAWFEAGPEPVYAVADAKHPSAFARVMILPRALLGGKSSISYVRPEDKDKPKSQRYQIFVDEPIDDLN